MFPRTKNRKAISTVLTTLIILVASVVLGTGVVLYGTSLFQTGAQSQAITVTGVQVWADKQGSGWAWGAADIKNSGDKLLSVNQIAMRGTQVPFTNWYVDASSDVTTANFQQALNYTGIYTGGVLNNLGKMNNYTGAVANAQKCATATPLEIYLFGQTASTASTPQLCFSPQTGPLSMPPGAEAIVYYKIPQTILTTVDAGSSGSVAIYAGNVGAPQTVTIASQ